MSSELQHRILKGEGVQLDFKHTITDKQKIAWTLCAFANTKGGSLLIGVKDNGKVKGVNPEEEYYMIEGAAVTYCKPEIEFATQVWQEGHHLVLEVIIEPSEVKVKALDDDGRWKFFHRVDDNTMLANKIVRTIWKLKANGSTRPTAFDESVLDFIKLIKESGPCSLSKLYRLAELPKSKVDDLISKLVYWGVVNMDIAETGTSYSINTEDYE